MAVAAEPITEVDSETEARAYARCLKTLDQCCMALATLRDCPAPEGDLTEEDLRWTIRAAAAAMRRMLGARS